MSIYYFLVEAVPLKDNPESEYLDGTFINCWVKATSTKDAIKKAKAYIKLEKWKWLYVEDMYIAEREMYLDEPDSLEAYDYACEYGAMGVFYTFSDNAED